MYSLITLIKKYHKILQILISAIILLIILRDINFNQLFTIIKSINIQWYIHAIIIFAFSVIIVSYKWWKILVFQGYSYEYKKIFKINLGASFYNQFLPSRVGGDAIKIFFLIKDRVKEKGKISMSVIIDRLFNLLGIILVAVFSSLTLKKDTTLFVVMISIFFSLILMLFFVVLISGYFKKKLFIKMTIVKKIINTLHSIKYYINSLKKILFMIIGGVLYAMLTFIMNYYLGKSLGINISLDYYLFFLPIIFVATIIPISFGGFGIREGGFVYFLGLVGVDQEHALSLSLLSYFTVLILSAPGYFLLIMDSSSKKDID